MLSSLVGTLIGWRTEIAKEVTTVLSLEEKVSKHHLRDEIRVSKLNHMFYFHNFLASFFLRYSIFAAIRKNHQSTFGGLTRER